MKGETLKGEQPFVVQLDHINQICAAAISRPYHETGDWKGIRPAGGRYEEEAEESALLDCGLDALVVS